MCSRDDEPSGWQDQGAAEIWSPEILAMPDYVPCPDGHVPGCPGSAGGDHELEDLTA